MAGTKQYARAFNGGEVTPEFYGRIDDIKYQTGLARCLNAIVLPHGPAEKRAGFQFVAVSRNNLSAKSRLLPFVFSPQDTAIVELTPGAFRFYVDGAVVLDGMVPFEEPHPYTEAELFEVTYYQVNDVMVLCHPNHPPAELKRVAPGVWEYAPISFGPTVSAPTGLTSTVIEVGPRPIEPEPLGFEYVITAVASDGTESIASSTATAVVDFAQTDDYVNLSWTAVSGAARYRVYRRQSGVFGFLAETTTTAYNDNGNVVPDFSRTPPTDVSGTLFAGAGNYPACAGEFQQRVFFGGTRNASQTIWGSKTGTRYDFNFSIPVLDTDGLSFRVASRQGSPIRHLIAQQDLIALTGSSEWRITGAATELVTPTSISARRQSAVGASHVSPVDADTAVIFASARGGRIFALGYSNERGGYVPQNLTLRAPHLFDGFDILDMAMVRTPVPIVWAVSTSGRLLGLTFLPDEEVYGWHAHETDGVVESVAAVAEGEYDALYAVILRNTLPTPIRTVERLALRRFDQPADGFFVDCGLTYEGPPVASVTGLSHLVGATVAVVADGAVLPRAVVPPSGTLTLPAEASVVHVGLPYTVELKELPASFEIPGFGGGRPKSVRRVWLRLYKSSAVLVSAGGREVEVKQRTSEPYGSPPTLMTGEFEAAIGDEWSLGGQVTIRQTEPLPLTVLAIIKEVMFGGD